VVALGDGVNNLDSLPSNELTYEVEVSLTQLNAITAGDFADLNFHFVNGYGGDQNQRRFIPHIGHAVFNQTGSSGTFLLLVFVDGVAHSAEFVISGETIIWYNGFNNSFLPDTLGAWSGTNQNNYVVHFIIVAEDNSGYANSEPFVTSIN